MWTPTRSSRGFSPSFPFPSAMDRRELLSRIATFRIVAEDLADDLVAGDFRSIFKGQGIEFDEVRPYTLGDDARAIDWNVSARLGAPYTKLFREERELSVLVILDASGSMASGSGPVTRWEQAVLATALLTLAAERAGERTGLSIFGAAIRRYLPPRKGRSHALAVVEAALSESPPDPGTDGGSELTRALAAAARDLKRRSLVIVLSDFLCSAWERPFASLSKRHDVVAIRLSDPLDAEMPNVGLISVVDPETGKEFSAPTSFPSFRRAWLEWQGGQRESWLRLCERRGAAALELSTFDDASMVLSRFFRSRRAAR